MEDTADIAKNIMDHTHATAVIAARRRAAKNPRRSPRKDPAIVTTVNLIGIDPHR
jgi:hypothetical protein